MYHNCKPPRPMRTGKPFRCRRSIKHENQIYFLTMTDVQWQRRSTFAGLQTLLFMASHRSQSGESGGYTLRTTTRTSMKDIDFGGTEFSVNKNLSKEDLQRVRQWAEEIYNKVHNNESPQI